MKIKNFFFKIFHWFKNNIWLQLVLLVGSLFSFILVLPMIVHKIKEKSNEKQKPDYFYTQYQVPVTKVESFITELQQNKNLKEQIIMFTPKENKIAANIKNSLQTLIKKEKVVLKVIFVNQEMLSPLYQNHRAFFEKITSQEKYLNYIYDRDCSMNEIKGFDDFLQNPVLILFAENKIKKIISNVCGHNDFQKNHFLKRFYRDQ